MTGKAEYKRYRMNERSPRKRKLDERVRSTKRRGNDRAMRSSPYTSVRYADELPERDFYEGNSPDY